MKGDDGEERGRHYDDEVREAEYGDSQVRRQAQFRWLVLVLFFVVTVIIAFSFLIPK